ncbi:MAG TPA: phosphatidate cytidylyltransferase [Terriglobales bacterium]|nr:phosphatidate cytidylyltransferase [Terriglobales bacterium]
MARALTTASPARDGVTASSALLRRSATTVVAVPALVWIVAYAPPWLFPLVIVLAAAAAAHELTALLDQAGHATLGVVGAVLAAAVAASFAFRGATMITLMAATGIALAAPLWRRGAVSIVPTAVTLLTVVYVGGMLGHAVWLTLLSQGPWLVLVLLGVTWTGETAAYLAGSTLGRHKLAPVLSPNKTIEGAVAQVIMSVGVAIALGLWLVPGTGAAFWAGAGVLVGVVGQVGDLVESAIKRSAKAKDAGGLIPGHGGLLDRLDSLFFNLPAFFYYVVLIGGRA